MADILAMAAHPDDLELNIAGTLPDAPEDIRGEFRPIDLDYTVFSIVAPMIFLIMMKHSLGACLSDEYPLDPERYGVLPIGITPDGPRGPNEVIAPGALQIAKRTGAPIYLMGVAAAPALHLVILHAPR